MQFLTEGVWCPIGGYFPEELEKRLSQTPIRAVRLYGSTPDNVKNEIKTDMWLSEFGKATKKK